ncbi:MAG: DUF3795 domain-containing protein [Halobacteriota archaeon]|nr:DUF3795 domain-containing protein [Halobacteriota archaeon]
MEAIILWQFIVFTVISFFSGSLAIYFWIGVYNEVKKGTIAWLLLALTSVFLITSSIFPMIVISQPQPNLTEVALVFLSFWSSLYTTTFGVAGFLIFRAFRTVPKENLGDFLLEGMTFQKPPTVPSACGTNCSLCSLHIEKACSGCFKENESGDSERCPIYICVSEKGFKTCWDCEQRPDCDKYRDNLEKSPIKDQRDHAPSVDEISNLMGQSAILEYTPSDRYEDAVIELTLRFFGELRSVVLISSEPRTSIYREKLSDLLDISVIKFVEISSTGDEITSENGIVKVPISCLDQFTSLFDKLPEGVRIIFEPISHLITLKGIDAIYPLISEVVEVSSEKKLDILAMMNSEVHDRETMSKFESLFFNRAVLSSDRIKVIKGKKGEFIRFMVGEKFFASD